MFKQHLIKTFSSKQHDELREAEERVQQNKQTHRHFSDYYKDIVKIHGTLHAQSTVKEHQHNVLTAQKKPFLFLPC